jgi:fatty acid desaturase
MPHSHSAQIETIKRIPNPQEPVPRAAAPTLALFAGGAGLWTTSTALALTGTWPWPISTALNTIAAFVLFTVAHEASHNTISTDPALNTWLGRISMLAFAPQAGFRAFRFIHMQHHRFTNHEDGRDPDHYTQRGPRWLLPLRWLTTDLWYMVWYLPKLRARPRGEQIEQMLALALTGAAVIALLATDNALALIALWLGPARLAVGLLGWAFDYLPHHGLHHVPSEDRFKTTRNRIGAEPVLTPLLLYQNYHLVHHLHPVIPFYRYIAVWRRRESDYLAHGPVLSSPRGRPLTVDEYRALRAMH